jgi:hypothetical protein
LKAQGNISESVLYSDNASDNLSVDQQYSSKSTLSLYTVVVIAYRLESSKSGAVIQQTEPKQVSATPVHGPKVYD